MPKAAAHHFSYIGRPLRRNPTLATPNILANMTQLHTGTDHERLTALTALAAIDQIPAGANLKNLEIPADVCKKLQGRTMKYANLTGARFQGALVNTNLQESHSMGGLQMNGANVGVQMNGSIHYGARIASLRRSSVRNALLAMCNLAGADMQGADMRNTSFYMSNLNGADATGANFNNADMSFASAMNAGFEGADMNMEIAPRLTAARFGRGTRMNNDVATAAMQSGAIMNSGAYEIEDLKIEADTPAPVRTAALQRRLRVPGIGLSMLAA